MSRLPQILALFALATIVVALLIRYFYWLIDRDLRDAARLEDDPAYRRERLALLDTELARAPDDRRRLWYRVDLLRLEERTAAAIRDLKHLSELSPADDKVWGELAECRLLAGEPRSALAAAEQATALDPRYPDYQAVKSRAALLAGDLPAAAEAIATWSRLENETLAAEQTRRTPKLLGRQPLPPREPDPYLRLIKAALAQREGDAALTDKWLTEARALDEDMVSAALANDPALAGLRNLAAPPD